WEHAVRDVVTKRGGPALLATLCGPLSESELLAEVVATASLWRVDDNGELRGFGLCRGGVVEAIYVDHAYRRQKAATTLVRKLLATSTPPSDAYALPGDRAMKSLYESLGWKARLLTMRGA
ncbi:MAG: GNAT family N-acetyltransferase, partial [Acidimicrobiales bacterium]